MSITLKVATLSFAVTQKYGYLDCRPESAKLPQLEIVNTTVIMIITTITTNTITTITSSIVSISVNIISEQVSTLQTS